VFVFTAVREAMPKRMPKRLACKVAVLLRMGFNSPLARACQALSFFRGFESRRKIQGRTVASAKWLWMAEKAGYFWSNFCSGTEKSNHPARFNMGNACWALPGGGYRFTKARAKGQPSALCR